MARLLAVAAVLSTVLFCEGVSADEHPDILYRQGLFFEAEVGYARLATDNPDDLRYRYNEGCAAYQSSDYRAAREAFTSVLRRAGEDGVRFRTLFNLGNTALLQDEFSAAMAYYTQALLLNPESPEARYNLEIATRSREKLKKKKNTAKREERSRIGADKKGGRGQGGGGEEEHEQPGEIDDKDLTGELEQMEGSQEDFSEEEGSAKPTAVMDRKKARDLLGKIKEDRSLFMHFQIAKSKEPGIKSGKDW